MVELDELIDLHKRIELIANTSIDIWKGTPILKLMYERKLCCECYLDESGNQDKEYCLYLLKTYDSKIKQALAIE